MSGVMHAPLTGVFLIAELTGGYDLFLPLMIVSVSSYLTIIMFEPHSIYSMRLAKKGELLTHHIGQGHPYPDENGECGGKGFCDRASRNGFG